MHPVSICILALPNPCLLRNNTTTQICCISHTSYRVPA
jgi:hypothetical protein